MKTAPLVEFRSVSLDPPINRRVIYFNSSFLHHFFQVAVAQGISQVPSDTQQDDVRLEVTPFERLLGVQGWVSVVEGSKYKCYFY